MPTRRAVGMAPESRSSHARRADAETASARRCFYARSDATGRLISGGEQPGGSTVYSHHFLRGPRLRACRADCHVAAGPAVAVARRDLGYLRGHGRVDGMGREPPATQFGRSVHFQPLCDSRGAGDHIRSSASTSVRPLQDLRLQPHRQRQRQMLGVRDGHGEQ